MGGCCASPTATRAGSSATAAAAALDGEPPHAHAHAHGHAHAHAHGHAHAHAHGHGHSHSHSHAHGHKHHSGSPNHDAHDDAADGGGGGPAATVTRLSLGYKGPAPAPGAPTIAVFPASSGTGMRTLEALLSSAHRGEAKWVQAVTHSDAGVRNLRFELGPLLATEPVELVTNVDMGDADACRSAFKGVDRLFLIPPNTPNRVAQCTVALEAAKAAGVTSVVVLSVLGAAEEKSSFSRAFRAVERVAAAGGFTHVTFLRAATFMDNFLVAAHSIVDAGKFFGSHGEGKFPIVSLADVGRVAAHVLMEPQEFADRAIDVTGPLAHSGAECAAIMTRVLGRTLKYVDVTPEAMLDTLLGGGMQLWEATNMVESFSLIKSGDAALAATEEVARITNVHTSFEDFCRDRKLELLGEPSPILAVLPGSGNVGGQTVAALARMSRLAVWPDACAGNPRVRVVVKDVRDPSLADLPSNFSVVAGDIADTASIDGALRGVSRLLFVTPTIENRTPLAHQMLAAAKRAGVEHVVLMSILQCHTEAFDAMRQFRGLEKALAGLGDGTKWTSLRLGSFSQNFLASAAEVAEKGELTGALGTGRVAYVDVDDVGAAFATVLREGPALHHEKVYELTGPESLSMSECASILSEVLGRPITYVDVSPEELGQRLVESKRVPEWFVRDVLVDYNSAFRAGKGDLVSPDLARLAGRQTTFREFVERSRVVFAGPPSAPSVIQEQGQS